MKPLFACLAALMLAACASNQASVECYGAACQAVFHVPSPAPSGK